MEGWLAGIVAIIGGTDMYLNDCQVECFAYSDAPGRFHFQLGATEHNHNWISQEILLGYDLPRKYGPFQPIVSASLTGTGDAWVGAGLKWTSEHRFHFPIYFEGYAMPGLYSAGDGPDIGGFIQFRGSIGLGYEFDNGIRAVVGYDHRSNAGIWEENSGLETLHLRISVPME